MEKESKKQKKDIEEKEEETLPYDSEDSANNFGASTVHTYYATENWKSVDEPYGTDRYR
jgi:hypothetical protein